MKILYFAWVRERTGISSETIACPDDVHTVGDLLSWLGKRGDGYAEAFENNGMVRAAVNQEHVDLTHPINDNDEVAFFPPVTGGIG
jgi:sulfur-carrier protein